MPNWCENELIIRGPKQALETALQAMKGEESDFDFNQLIPYPSEFQEADEVFSKWFSERYGANGAPTKDTERPKDGFNSGGYEWCVENWGTKWNAAGVAIRRVGDSERMGESIAEVMVSFDTAWAPPLPVVKALGERFSELDFELRYFECGVAFFGCLLIEEGTIRAEFEGKYFGKRGG